MPMKLAWWKKAQSQSIQSPQKRKKKPFKQPPYLQLLSVSAGHKIAFHRLSLNPSSSFLFLSTLSLLAYLPGLLTQRGEIFKCKAEKRGGWSTLFNLSWAFAQKWHLSASAGYLGLACRRILKGVWSENAAAAPHLPLRFAFVNQERSNSPFSFLQVSCL